MRMKGLSLETIPPIHIPFRFFNTAPWMGVTAGVLLLLDADTVLVSQWSPGLLAATHLLSLGFMAMIMIGAIFQVVPVISGEMIPGGVKVATAVHLCLTAGVFVLSAGFYWQAYWLFNWAAPLLLLAFVIFLAALGILLLRQTSGGDAIYSIRFAAMSLLITVGLGLLRAANYAGLADPLAFANITNVHLAWGLGGWVLLLVMGVSYQVIPMFHVTPNFPGRLARGLPLAVFFSLLALTVISDPLVQCMALLVLASSAVVFALVSIRLLLQRKRKLPDITARFWHLSLCCLIAAAFSVLLLYFSPLWIPGSALSTRLAIGIGLLSIYGFATSVIMGMLQKIVPFLAYLHMQRRSMSNFELLKTLPHMGEIVPPERSRWQFRLHVMALASLLIANFSGSLVPLAGGFVVADFAFLGYTLAGATSLYVHTARRISDPRQYT